LVERIIETTPAADSLGAGTSAEPEKRFRTVLPKRLFEARAGCEFCNEIGVANPEIALWLKGFTASIEVTY
jgi:hypothetical protein